MVVKFPCSICYRAVAKDHKSIQCDACEKWVHIRCNYICNKTYTTLLNTDLSWYCINCSKGIFPFASISNEDFQLTLEGKNFVIDSSSNLSIDHPTDLRSLFKELNNVNLSGDLTETSKYYTPSEINKLKINKQKIMSYFHLNISSLSYHIDELHTLLSLLDIKFDVIGITESRIQANNPQVTNISLQNYTIEHCPTEASKGGALLYINNNINYKVRKNLTIYKKKQLESVFIETINKKGKNTIIGCIYRHPSMTINDFNDNFLSPLLEKLSFENKNITLLGDFNINLLNYDTDNYSAEFLDIITSNSLLPTITKPTRITPNSKTLIDNILINETFDDIISGNITTTISDHMAQFLIKTNPVISHTKSKATQYKRDFKQFDKENFLLDILSIDWNRHLLLNNKDVNYSMNTFCDIISSLLDRYAPYKKQTLKNQTNKLKPWLTSGIITSINKKHSIYKKLIKAKSTEKKDSLSQTYKSYRNMLTHLSRKSKINYYKNYFKENKNNLKVTWKGIKSIINCAKASNDSPTILNINNKTIF